MFWIVAAVMTAITGLVIMVPIRRARGAAEPAAAFDLRVYRDQLTEVERDLDRGVIQPEDAVRLRTEIGRKVLDADRRAAQTVPASGRGPTLWAGLALVAMLGAGVALYVREGVPGAPDMPLSDRLAAADAAYRARPAQAEAEAGRPPAQTVPIDAEYRAMIEQLREAVGRNPDDPRGLELLATHEMRTGNLTAAREAQARLVAVRGDQVGAVELMQLASLMMQTAGGLVTPEAEAVLARALTLDPDQPQARYLQGVLFIQNGRPDRAFPIWRDLLQEGPETAPWIPSIRAAIADLAWLAGDADYQPPALDAAAGPDAAALEAARDLPPEERDQMILGMVEGLQQRLAGQGGSPEEWAQLIGALAVLGRTDQARAILTEARQRFGDTPEAIAPIDRAAQQAGLSE